MDTADENGNYRHTDCSATSDSGINSKCNNLRKHANKECFHMHSKGKNHPSKTQHTGPSVGSSGVKSGVARGRSKIIPILEGSNDSNGDGISDNNHSKEPGLKGVPKYRENTLVAALKRITKEQD